MKLYLLDTPILTAGLMDRPATVALLAEWISHDEAATSIVVYGEIVEYLQGRSDFAARHERLRDLLGAVTPYFVTYAIMARYATVRRQLRPPHGPGLIGDIDTVIAATALEHDLTVVTTDHDYERVPNLKVQVLPRQSL